MPIQAFADESVGGHFAMAGLIADSEAWADFSDEWRLALKDPPAISYLKMSQAAGLSGEFYGFASSARDKKLTALAKIINRYARIYTHSVIDLDAFAKVWKGNFSHTDDPYFWPFQNTILSAGYSLVDLGIRERFEMIFDEHLIFGERARVWYPVLRELVRLREPNLFTVLPLQPLFGADDEFMPLQAADMFAWCARRQMNGDESFDWLLQELQNIRLSEYSQYIDAARMRSIMDLSDKMRREETIEQELVRKYREVQRRVYGDRSPK